MMWTSPIANAIAFNSKALHDLDLIGDNEIRAQYGDDIDVNAVREAFRGIPSTGHPKIDLPVHVQSFAVASLVATSDFRG